MMESDVTKLNLGDSVAGDFLRVALDADSGKLRHCGVLAEAARAALVIDLVRLGLLTQDGEQIVAGPNASGLVLADDLLNAIAEHPKRSVQVMLQRGVPHLHEFIAELLLDGYWTLERHGIIATHARYTDSAAARYDHLRLALIDDIQAKREPADSREAALAALVNVTGLGAPSPQLHRLPDQLRDACHELAWIVEEVTTFLYDAQADALAAGTVSATTTAITLGSV
jgi:hypothetical protein